MSFHNKRIVITGGTSGIGLALVKELAVNNYIIVISRKGTLTKQLLNAKHPVQLYHADLANKAEIESVVDKIQRQERVIDVLINNAAIQHTPEFLATNFNYDSIQTEINVNFAAVCHLTYLFLPLLLAAEKGEILNVNSGLAIAPKQSSAVYCATKSALDSFSKSLSYQLEGTTVAVRQAFLPLVQTAMTEGRVLGKLPGKWSGKSSEKLQAEDVATQIIRGVVREQDVNDIGKVRFLRLLNYLMPPLAQRIMKGRPSQ